MKPEEVIETLKTKKVTEFERRAVNEAINTAIDALKKQIPMKPIGEHYAHMRCPSCNHRIPSGGGSSSRRRDNWCNYCGQKIDWSNE